MVARITAWIKRVQWAYLLETLLLIIAGFSGVIAILSYTVPVESSFAVRNEGTLLAFAVVVGPWVALRLRGDLRRRKTEHDLREKDGFHPSGNLMIDAIIHSLKHRARRLYSQAQMVLWLILGTLGAGIYVFATADQLSRSPVTSVADRLEDYGESVGRAIIAVENIASDSSESAVYNAVTNLRLTLTVQENIIKSAQDVISSRADEVTASMTVSTLSTRVGIVLMILFLVQILVTMYRYNSRLAAHLEGRAVALQLASLQQNQQWQISELIALFSGDSVDFGKLPPTAIQSFADVVKHTATGVVKKATP